MDNATPSTAHDRVQMVMPPPPESVHLEFTPDELAAVMDAISGRGDLRGAYFVFVEACGQLNNAGHQIRY